MGGTAIGLHLTMGRLLRLHYGARQHPRLRVVARGRHHHALPMLLLRVHHCRRRVAVRLPLQQAIGNASERTVPSDRLAHSGGVPNQTVQRLQQAPISGSRIHTSPRLRSGVPGAPLAKLKRSCRPGPLRLLNEALDLAKHR